jgi:hypothetical protein
MCRHASAKICAKLSVLLVWMFAVVSCMVLWTSLSCVRWYDLLVRHLFPKFQSTCFLCGHNGTCFFKLLVTVCNCFVSRWISVVYSCTFSSNADNRLTFSWPQDKLCFYMQSFCCIEATDHISLVFCCASTCTGTHHFASGPKCSR